MSKYFFEKHPVSAERKAALRSQGFTILDEQFKPADYENPAEAAESKKDGSGKGQTVEQIKQALADLGIEIPDGVTKKADLQALLDDAKD